MYTWFWILLYYHDKCFVTYLSKCISVMCKCFEGYLRTVAILIWHMQTYNKPGNSNCLQRIYTFNFNIFNYIFLTDLITFLIIFLNFVGFRDVYFGILFKMPCSKVYTFDEIGNLNRGRTRSVWPAQVSIFDTVPALCLCWSILSRMHGLYEADLYLKIYLWMWCNLTNLPENWFAANNKACFIWECGSQVLKDLILTENKLMLILTENKWQNYIMQYVK